MINYKGAKINLLVVGLGKLGLPFCAVLAESGHQVFGVDKSVELVTSLKSKEFHSTEPKLMELLEDVIVEKWSTKYKKTIDCSNPRGFSQKAHCAARKKRRAGGDTKSKPVK